MDKIITIAGASGVVGRHIIDYFHKHNYKIRILSRSEKPLAIGDVFKWNPDGNNSSESTQNTIKAIDGADILINLAGVSLSEGRLNSKLQSRILQSRINSTRALISAFQSCKNPPRFWGQASAVGYYGNTANDDVLENRGPGNLFLSSVCVQWEKLLLDFSTVFPDLKIVIGRFGLVLADDAPAWQRILSPIKMGLGGPIGSGNQWYSWIDADDIASAFLHLFNSSTSEKIFNFTSPEPVTQKDFTIRIARLLKRPSFFKIPAFLVKLLLGKGAEELLLTSCKALPKRLADTGYKFKYESFNSEIKHLLEKS